MKRRKYTETPAGQLKPVTSWDCAKCSSHRRALWPTPTFDRPGLRRESRI